MTTDAVVWSLAFAFAGVVLLLLAERAQKWRRRRMRRRAARQYAATVRANRLQEAPVVERPSTRPGHIPTPRFSVEQHTGERLT